MRPALLAVRVKFRHLTWHLNSNIKANKNDSENDSELHGLH